MSRSDSLFAAAQRVIPGGVNSPARAFGAVGGEPPFIARASGAYLFDIDGNRYLDFAARPENRLAALGVELGPSGRDSESPFEEEVARVLLGLDEILG